MTENETTIFKNAVLDSTEAYVDARLKVLDYARTQIGTVINYVSGKFVKIVPVGNENPHTRRWYEYDSSTYTYVWTSDTTVQEGKTYYIKKYDGKYYHNVECDNGRVVYTNILSIGNTAFPAGSVVFLIIPNAQVSNQFILGKLDNTPVNMTAGSINIGNGAFKVDSNGNMTATTGEIGDFTLESGNLFTWGVVNLQSGYISASSGSSIQRVLCSFTPATLGVLSEFTITFSYRIVTTSSRPMKISLEYFDIYNNQWNVYDQQPLETARTGETEVYTFIHTFDNNDTDLYRIVFYMNGTSSSSYQQSLNYSIYTNRVIRTAITTDGYFGSINSASGIIGNIEYATGRLSSLQTTDRYDGFELDNDSLEIKTNNITQFMYSKHTSWADGTNRDVHGLFVNTDDSVYATTLCLYKDNDNYLELDSEGYYDYNINGISYSGTLGGSSDERVKEDITPLDDKMSKDLINNTKTYKFKYKRNEGYHYGVIAQEARKLLDDLGEKDSRLEYSVGDKNIKDQRTINYVEYIPPLINVVQDLQRQIDELKKEDK